MKKKIHSLDRRRRRAGYWFTLPFTIGMLFFLLGPLVQSVLFSFQKLTVVPGGYTLSMVGWENYRYAFLVDDQFRRQLFRSVRDMLINVPVVVLFSFFMASILNQKFVGRGLVRAIFFLPVIIASGTVQAALSSDALSSLSNSAYQSAQMGEALTLRITDYLQEMNISPAITQFVIDTVGRVYEIAVMSAVPIIIFLAGLQSVSPALFEASFIEGAGKWEVFWKISFPMVSPLILVAVVYCIVDSFTSMTNEVVARIHRTAFSELNFGLSSALAWSYLCIVFAILILVYRLISRHIHYD
ncbi:MAG TPA: sugar ABC transporter permease [Firmicutes bacterium]|nr:sugar ABC transporter permease [Bacillota bacterium]